MLKIVALVQKREDLDWDDFVEYWDERHREVVAEVDTLRKYTIAPAIDPENAPYDGVAELYFESTDAIREGFDGDVTERIAADEEKFLDESITFVAAEQTQIDRT